MGLGRRGRAACVVGVLLIAALLAALPAGRRSFWSSDEARFALLGQDVLDHGRWLVAQIRGREYLNKPQLFFWMVAVASLPFGRVTELSAALPTVLASIVAVAGVVALGCREWGWKTGALAGLVLATTPLHFEMAHLVLPDMVVSACLVWALYFLLGAARAGWAWPPLAGFYACVTVALLSKGPAALAALAAAVVAVALTDGVAALRRLRLPLGVTAMLAVAAAVWLAPYHLRSVGRFEGQVIGGHYATWYLQGAGLARLANLDVPLFVFLPWTLLLAAAPSWWRRAADPARKRVVLWTLTLWLVIGLSGNFRARYVLPVLPGFALLTAELLTAPVAGRAARLRWAALLACGALVLAAGVVVFVPALLGPVAAVVGAEDRAFLPTAAWEQSVIVVLAVAAAAALILGARRRATTAAAGLGVALVALFALVGVTYPPRYTHAFDVRPLAAAAAASLPRDGVVIGYPDLRLSYDVYLGRRVVELRDEPAVRARLASGERAAFIMSEARWEPLAPEAGPAWHVLASRPLRGRLMVTVGAATP